MTASGGGGDANCGCDAAGGSGGTITLTSSSLNLGTRSILVRGGDPSGAGLAGSAGSVVFASGTNTLTDSHGSVTAQNSTYNGVDPQQVVGHWIYASGILNYNVGYLIPGNISTCGYIYFSGTYTLTSNVSVGSGACFIVLVDSAIIDANSHSITGNIIGDGTIAGTAGHSFTVENATSVTGNIIANGASGDNSSNNGGSGGTISIISSNVSGDIRANGGDHDSNDDNGNGGEGGSITITTSTVTGNLTADGMNGANGYTSGNGGNIDILSASTINLTSGSRHIEVTGGDSASNGSITFSSGINHLTDEHGTATVTNGVYNASGLIVVGGHFIYNTGIIAYNGSVLVPGNIDTCGALYFPGTYTLTAGVSDSGTCFTIVAQSGVVIDGASHTIVASFAVDGSSQGDGTNGRAFTVKNATITGNIIANGSDDGNSQGLDAGNITLDNVNVTGNVSTGFVDAGNAGTISVTNNSVIHGSLLSVEISGGIPPGAPSNISVSDSTVDLSSGRTIDVANNGGNIGTVTLINTILHNDSGGINSTVSSFNNSGITEWVFQPYWSAINGVVSSTPLPDTQAPVLQSASISGSELTLTFDDTDLILNDTSSLEVRLDGNHFASASGGNVSGNTVTIDLTTGAFANQGSFTLYYDSSTFVHDTAGNYVDAQNGYSIANYTPNPGYNDPDAPNFNPDATVDDGSCAIYLTNLSYVNGTTLRLIYNRAPTIIDSSALTIDEATVGNHTFSSAVVSNNDLVVTLDSTVSQGTAVTISYIGLNFGQDSLNNVLADQTNLAVTNSTGDITPPTLSITSPTTGTITTFTPSVSWGDSASCAYEYDGGGFTSVVCASNGANIPAPSSGAHTLTIKGVDASINIATASVSFTYSPVTNNGGGGGGGGSTPVSRAQDAPLAASSSAPIVPPLGCKAGDLFSTITGAKCPANILSNIPNPLPAGFKFTKNLLLGSPRSIDVKNLQIFLNHHGFSVSKSGAGSLGYESTYFGPATKAALIKFQIANHITPSIGYFGPKTRTFVNALLSK